MIESLFDEDKENTQSKIEPINQNETRASEVFSADENSLLEIHSAGDAGTNNFVKTPVINDLKREQTATISQDSDKAAPNNNTVAPNINFTLSSPFEPTVSSKTPKKNTDDEMLFQMHSKPESTDETARKSGLAMSAAIALFGSVVFLLIIGWFADLLLGTSPWGIVGGIVLGSLIGFFQFFKMTSQILKNKD